MSTPTGAQERFTALADPNNAMAPQAPANEPLAFGCLVVARDAHVTGVLAVPGSLRVEGRIDGEIDAAEVIVLPGGSIVGELRCGSANIQGTVRGVLRCNGDRLHSAVGSAVSTQHPLCGRGKPDPRGAKAAVRQTSTRRSTARFAPCGTPTGAV